MRRVKAQPYTGKRFCDAEVAWVVSVIPRSPEDEIAFKRLFDRSANYAEIVAELQEVRKRLASKVPAELAKLNKRLAKHVGALQRIDFFPNEASAMARVAWSDFLEAVNAVLSPNEPHPAQRQIARLNPGEYQGRIWATRRHLWVDRVASAWLMASRALRVFVPEAAAACAASACELPLSTHTAGKASSKNTPSHCIALAQPSEAVRPMAIGAIAN